MITPENVVFNKLATVLREEYPGILVTGEYQSNSTTFPVVTIIESDNSVLTKTITTKIENAVELTYEINVYSNKVGYKKKQCDEIFAVVDDEMVKMGFVRTLRQPVPNYADSTIYRVTARYRGICDADYRIYTD